MVRMTSEVRAVRITGKSRAVKMASELSTVRITGKSRAESE